ncbi:MAG: hypothetical protein HONBIEJF_00539 [Fimbriimonadaceae bacterium]|nr:hypothetical protein [Fimbriimonadaceae bacterium]
MILGLSLLALGGCQPQVTLFVDPRGNDKWSGRLARANKASTDGPLATLDGARLKLRSVPKGVGATVKIASGTYRITRPVVFEPEDSGTAEGVRRYEGPGARSGDELPAVVSGMRSIKGWKKLSNGWFRTNLPEVKAGKWDFIQLFANGERRYRPRLPKKGYQFISERVDPTPESKGKGNDRFQFLAGEIRGDWANRDDVDVLAFHQWIMSRNRIRDVDARGSIVTFKAPTGTDAPWRDFLKGHRYLVENVKEALSEPGEWYLDRPTGDLTYIPKQGETLATLRVEAPVAESLIEFRGDSARRNWVHHIDVVGLRFEGTNWVTPPAGRNFPQAEVDLGGAVTFAAARDCKFDGCDLAHLGTYAIDIGAACKRIEIAKNTMADLGAGGIKVGKTDWEKDPELLTERCLVQVNFISGGGRLHPAAVGVWVGQNPYIHVGGNFIHDFYYTGISVGWSWGYQANGAHHNTILGNRIGHIGQGVLSDMGGIYTLGPQPGTVIQRNQIHDVQSFSYGGWGIYPDEGSTGILIENNVVFRTKSAGFHQHYGKENIVRNNVFAFGREAQIMRTRAEPHLSFTMERNLILFDDAPLLGSNWTENNYKLDNNLYWREGGKPFDFAGLLLEAWRAKGQDVHSVIADPMFVDPKTGDFRLKPGSPALKIGFKPFTQLDSRCLAERKPLARAFP